MKYHVFQTETEAVAAEANPTGAWLLNTRLSSIELMNSTVTPTWAGSNYPF